MTLILSSEATRSIAHENLIVVGTPLDAITRLEARVPISTLVLAGSYARDEEVAQFFAEFYPSIGLEHED